MQSGCNPYTAGEAVGLVVGLWLGDMLGLSDGIIDGPLLGDSVSSLVGCNEEVGSREMDGLPEGGSLGTIDGTTEGATLG